MIPTPTGRLLATDQGYDLVLTREFRAPVSDVWASVVEPERTARWFGRWEGESGPGRTVRLQMTAEEGDTWSDVRIDVCHPPHHLAVESIDASGTFRLELHLHERAGVTTLEFVQHLDSLDGVAQLGPGWEFYLDRLVAARAEAALPDWSRYEPQQDDYAALATEADATMRR